MTGRAIKKDLDDAYEGEYVEGKMEWKGKNVYTSGKHKSDAYDSDWRKGLR